MKLIAAGIIFNVFIFPFIVMAADVVNLPPQPAHTCNVATQTPAAYTACENQYTADMAAWNSNQDVVNYFSNPNTKPVLDSNGNIVAKAPVNNCLVSDPNYATCIANYNAAVTAFNSSAATAINGVQTQLNADATLNSEHTNMQQQTNQQAAEYNRMQNLVGTSATGILNEVQEKNRTAMGYYNQSGYILSKYADSIKHSGDVNNSLCTTGDFDACSKSAAGYATYVAYDDMALTAGNQAAEMGIAMTQACEAQKAVSTIQTSCDPSNPSSPIFTPDYKTPPNPSWFDPYTGLCAASAPGRCKEMFTVISTTDGLNQGLISAAVRTCPNGGTDCISTVAKSTTPQGVKYTFKSKVGKSFSIYANDVKDEKSLIKAGLSPALAKSVISEVKATQIATETTASKIVGGLAKLAQVAKSVFGISKDENDPNQKNKIAKNKPTTALQLPTQNSNSAAVSVNRRPSMEGLSREVGGDLIGVRGDNIFKMINRRYIEKNKQDSFF